MWDTDQCSGCSGSDGPGLWLWSLATLITFPERNFTFPSGTLHFSPEHYIFSPEYYIFWQDNTIITTSGKCSIWGLFNPSWNIYSLSIFYAIFTGWYRKPSGIPTVTPDIQRYFVTRGAASSDKIPLEYRSILHEATAECNILRYWMKESSRMKYPTHPEGRIRPLAAPAWGMCWIFHEGWFLNPISQGNGGNITRFSVSPSEYCVYCWPDAVFIARNTVILNTCRGCILRLQGQNIYIKNMHCRHAGSTF